MNYQMDFTELIPRGGLIVDMFSRWVEVFPSGKQVAGAATVRNHPTVGIPGKQP